MYSLIIVVVAGHHAAMVIYIVPVALVTHGFYMLPLLTGELQ